MSDLSSPARDIMPVTPDDNSDLAHGGLLYIETGGTLRVTTAKGEVRDLAVTDFMILPVFVTRIHATGTTATGIHALEQV